jgi:hypothetical protein
MRPRATTASAWRNSFRCLRLSLEFYRVGAHWEFFGALITNRVSATGDGLMTQQHLAAMCQRQDGAAAGQ